MAEFVFSLGKTNNNRSTLGCRLSSGDLANDLLSGQLIRMEPATLSRNRDSVTKPKVDQLDELTSWKVAL